MAVFKKQVNAITSGLSLGLNRLLLKVRLKTIVFLTALYFQPFSLSFLRFLSKYATFYAVNPTVTHLIL